MANPYKSPSSALHDNVQTREYSHAIIAAISSSTVIVAATYGAAYYAKFEVDHNKVFIMLAVISALIVALFLLVRHLRWYWAALIGPLVGCGLLVAFGLGIDYFGIEW
jgi:predicted RND superfamily exporter protein